MARLTVDELKAAQAELAEAEAAQVAASAAFLDAQRTARELQAKLNDAVTVARAKRDRLAQLQAAPAQRPLFEFERKDVLTEECLERITASAVFDEYGERQQNVPVQMLFGRRIAGIGWLHVAHLEAHFAVMGPAARSAFLDRIEAQTIAARGVAAR